MDYVLSQAHRITKDMTGLEVNDPLMRNLFREMKDLGLYSAKTPFEQFQMRWKRFVQAARRESSFLLPDEKKRIIQKRFKDGETKMNLAKEYGVSFSTIRRALGEKT